jgi:hypothetical protein
MADKQLYGINQEKIGQKVKEFVCDVKTSVHADGCPHSRVCARWTLRSAPINAIENFPEHISEESPSNISPQKPYPKFLNPRMTFENTPLSTSAVRISIGLSHVMAGS